MRPKCPCNGCQDRAETCHGDCQRYNDWKGVIALEAVARKAENDSHSTPKLNKDHTRMRLGIKQWNGKVR